METTNSLFSKQKLYSFFMGKAYPIIVGALVLIGHLTTLEFYLSLPVIVSVIIALLIVDSLRPLMTALLTFLFFLTIKNSPATPSESDYYLSGYRIWVLGTLFTLVFAALVIFFIRNKLINRQALSAIPMPLSSLALALAFIMGGAFSGVYNGASLGYALVQIVVFLVIFYVFYFGFERDNADGVVDYLVFLSAVIAVIVFVETMNVYLFSENIIVDGKINRDALQYGWGVCNNSAQALTVLIPVLFIGVVRSKHSALYFVFATLAWVGSILNISRTAFVVGTPIYLVALIVAYIYCPRKKQLLLAVPAVVALIGVIIAVKWDVVYPVIENYVRRGLDDNGRYALWEYGIDAFLEAPVFGKGFFGLDTGLFKKVYFTPQMMHNTPIQILAAQGIFGLLAYGYHRIETVIAVLRRPSFIKTMLGAALLSVLLGSLLENFIFYIHPMFYFSATLAVLFRVVAEQKKAEKTGKPVIE